MGLMLPHAPQFSLYESNIQALPAVAGDVGVAVSHYVTTAHTKNPTYTELLASTSFDASLVVVSLSTNSGNATDSSSLLDIAIGASSAETVIIPDLMAGFVGTTFANRRFIFPLRVPAGSRISARTQSALTTGSVYVFVEFFGGLRDPASWWCGQTVTCYGANAANSAGAKITAGSTGAETATPIEMGTTTQDHECLVFGVQGHPDDVAWNARAYHWDVGIDVASTSWLSRDAFISYAASTEYIAQWNTWMPIWTPVKSGSVLVVAGECSGTSDPMSAAVYGIS